MAPSNHTCLRKCPFPPAKPDKCNNLYDIGQNTQDNIASEIGNNMPCTAMFWTDLENHNKTTHSNSKLTISENTPYKYRQEKLYPDYIEVKSTILI